MNSKGICVIVVSDNSRRFLNYIDVSSPGEAEAATPAADHPKSGTEYNYTKESPSKDLFDSFLAMVIWAAIIVTGVLQS